MAHATEDPSINKEPDCHKGGAQHERWATTDTIHPDQSWDGHDHVNDVLDAGRYQKIVACQPGHSEDVCDIVHHSGHWKLAEAGFADTSLMARSGSGFGPLLSLHV